MNFSRFSTDVRTLHQIFHSQLFTEKNYCVVLSKIKPKVHLIWFFVLFWIFKDISSQLFGDLEEFTIRALSMWIIFLFTSHNKVIDIFANFIENAFLKLKAIIYTI